MPNWNDILKEINLDEIRKKYLEQLHTHTQRNVIAYYSGWLTKPQISQLCGISDEDKNGFMMAVHKLDKQKGLDLILHTPGGEVGATQSLVDYLRIMFKDDIRAIIPQIAMSAGTMIACSCKEILMGKHSNIGPIDPQINGMPAHGVIQELERAHREIKQDQTKAYIWQPIIQKYPLGFFSQCANAISWAEDFVKEQLNSVMFKKNEGVDQNDKNIDKFKETIDVGEIVKKLSDYDTNKNHSNHISAEEAKKIGLKVVMIESDQTLQDLVLTVHHAYMHSLTRSPAYKIIENHLGNAFIKYVGTPQ